MDITVLQLDIAWEDKPKNSDKVKNLLSKAKITSGSICVLPEMFNSGFSMDVHAIAEHPAHSETKSFLAELARKYGIFVIGGLAELSTDGRGRNIACIFNPEGKLIGEYCKLHPFSFAGEDNYYLPGDSITTFECNDFIVCPFICYDLRFPEIFRQAVVKFSANLFIIIANWPATRREHWITLLKARAIENQAYVIGANRTGQDPNHNYAGDSMIISPKGDILANAGADETVIQATIDIKIVKNWRAKFPVLNDIRFI